ncbi:MAG: universal stress protein [Rubrivivax sp.]|nr:universal stress protein [Rubrivivax sp.]MDP3614344.1 universal stress protein [Rubrivivax sp.]
MFKRILVIVEVDGSPEARAMAVALALQHNAELVFFSLLPRYPVPVADAPLITPMSNEEFDQQARQSAVKLLDAAVREAENQGVMSRAAIGAGDDNTGCIVDAALKRHCDLIVAAGDGRNAVMRLITGSLIPGLITRSPVPLLIIDAGHPPPAAGSAPPPLRRILVVVEDREAARSAVEEGLALARWHGAEVLFVHPTPRDMAPVVDGSAVAAVSGDAWLQALHAQAERVLAQAMAAAAAQGVPAQALRLADGTSGHAVAASAQQQACELIVIAHEGHNAVMRMITGSVLPGLVTAATVPVLVCRDASTTAAPLAVGA